MAMVVNEKPHFSCSDDYACLDGGPWEFYYGYEKTDADGNWCFVAEHNGREVACWPWKKFAPGQWEVAENIGLGIATFAYLGLFDRKEAPQ
jgi:hypothetical protein